MPLRFVSLLRLAAPVLLLTLNVLPASAAGTDDGFPYTARVSGTNVRVRSGPGKNYYVTRELQYGDQVEVYRHDPGGWYAVRPPAGSFSWVSARYLKPSGDDTATVVGDRVVARVGSRLSDVRDVIQIRLNRGETVRVLESRRLADGATSQTWYKIAPPAGEFRWIYGKYVQKQLRAAITVDSTTRGNLLIKRQAHASRDVAPQPLNVDHTDDIQTVEEAVDRDARFIVEQDQPRSKRTVQVAGRLEHQDDTRGPAAFDREPANIVVDSGWSSTSQSAAAQRRSHASVATDDEESDYRGGHDQTVPFDPGRDQPQSDKELLAELDLLLSAVVAEDPSRWDFGEMEAEAEELLARGQTAVERGRARLLLKKIDRFEDIRRRWVAVEQLTASTERRNRQLQSVAASRTVAADKGSAARFDGQGRLTQVISRKFGAPRYALLNSDGQVRYFVTPAPGVNLRPYVGQQVGVSGSRGYMSEYRRQHVTAKRITVLDGPLLR